MEANKFKKMMKKVEDMLAAASFAEEGERETADSLLKEGRRVLLAVKQGRIDAKTVKYALNSSKRVGAGLDVLSVSTAGALSDPELQALEAELNREKIPYRMIRTSGCLKQAVIDYTNREREILFAIVESGESLDADCRKNSRLAELWQQLNCPVVVVMDGA